MTKKTMKKNSKKTAKVQSTKSEFESFPVRKVGTDHQFKVVSERGGYYRLLRILPDGSAKGTEFTANAKFYERIAEAPTPPDVAPAIAEAPIDTPPVAEAPKVEQGANDAPPVEPPAKRRRAEAKAPQTPDPRMPAVGTVIQKRDRNGQVRCECQVVEGGVLYKSTTYKSLSAAALTASRDLGLNTKAVDGWAWWGLKTRTTPAVTKNALERLDRAWQKYRERADAVAKCATGDELAKVHDALRAQGAVLVQIATPAPAAE